MKLKATKLLRQKLIDGGRFKTEVAEAAGINNTKTSTIAMCLVRPTEFEAGQLSKVMGCELSDLFYEEN
jgi:hypothetical protein